MSKLALYLDSDLWVVRVSDQHTYTLYNSHFELMSQEVPDVINDNLIYFTGCIREKLFINIPNNVGKKYSKRGHNLNDFNNYSIYGSGIRGVHSPVFLPSMKSLILNKSLYVSNCITTIFLKIVVEFINYYFVTGNGLEKAKTAIDLLAGFSNVPIFDDEGHQILKEIIELDYLENLRKSWHHVNRTNVKSSTIWKDVNIPDDINIAPITLILTILGFDSIVNAGVVCIEDNSVILPSYKGITDNMSYITIN